MSDQHWKGREAFTLADWDAALDAAYKSSDRGAIESIRATQVLLAPGFKDRPDSTTSDALERVIELIREGDVGVFDYRDRDGNDGMGGQGMQYFHPGNRRRYTAGGR